MTPLNFRLKAKAMVQCLTVNFLQMETILPVQILMGICCFLVLDAVNIMKRLVYLILVIDLSFGLYNL